jgi:hypothetical protein
LSPGVALRAATGAARHAEARPAERRILERLLPDDRCSDAVDCLREPADRPARRNSGNMCILEPCRTPARAVLSSLGSPVHCFVSG